MIAKETKQYEGFYEIRGFNRYAVSGDGKVINKSLGKLLEGCQHPSGYFNYGLTDDNGFKTTVGRHRVLMIAFKDQENFEVVNHLNGVKGDDRLDNLEWTTHRGNLEHAEEIGLTNNYRPIDVRDIDTGEVVRYPSMGACAVYLGFSKDAIKWRVDSGEERVFPERKQYRYGKITTPWFIPDVSRSIRFGTSRSVLLKDVITDVVQGFERATDVCDFLGASAASVSIWIRDPNQPRCKDRYLLKWEDSETEWRNVGTFIEESLRSRSRRVVKVIDVTTG